MFTQSAIRCLVVGNGAVGTAIASRLQMLNYWCQFVGRRGPVYIKSRFEGWGRACYLNIKPLSEEDLSQVDIAFVTVKAFDLGGALDRYLPYLPKRIPIIPLSNGAIEHVVCAARRKFPDFLWRVGVCNFGVTQISDHIFSLKSERGMAVWGALRPDESHRTGGNSCISQAEKEILASDSGIFLKWEKDIIPTLRKKWLFNVVINSLAASEGYEKNGLLLNDIQKLRATFEEACRLGAELWGRWKENSDKLFQDLISLISATAENENSMARDVRMGRRTENEFLAGMSLGRRGFTILNGLAEDIRGKSRPSPSGSRRGKENKDARNILKL